MFYASLSRMHGWAFIIRPHTGVPEIGRLINAQPCRDHSGALRVASIKCENDDTGSALPCVRAVWGGENPPNFCTHRFGGVDKPQNPDKKPKQKTK